MYSYLCKILPKKFSNRVNETWFNDKKFLKVWDVFRFCVEINITITIGVRYR